jgi:hypothetical protein
MSNETRELIQICEQLPAEQRNEVMNYARFLLAGRVVNATSPATAVEATNGQGSVAEQWLIRARGVARGSGWTTDQTMNLTRGES